RWVGGGVTGDGAGWVAVKLWRSCGGRSRAACGLSASTRPADDERRGGGDGSRGSVDRLHGLDSVRLPRLNRAPTDKMPSARRQRSRAETNGRLQACLRWRRGQHENILPRKG